VIVHGSYVSVRAAEGEFCCHCLPRRHYETNETLTKGETMRLAVRAVHSSIRDHPERLKLGFRSTGLYPLDRSVPLSLLHTVTFPQEVQEQISDDVAVLVDPLATASAPVREAAAGLGPPLLSTPATAHEDGHAAAETGPGQVRSTRMSARLIDGVSPNTKKAFFANIASGISEAVTKKLFETRAHRENKARRGATAFTTGKVHTAAGALEALREKRQAQADDVSEKKLRAQARLDARALRAEEKARKAAEREEKKRAADEAKINRQLLEADEARRKKEEAAAILAVAETGVKDSAVKAKACKTPLTAPKGPIAPKKTPKVIRKIPVELSPPRSLASKRCRK
jgi:hypothetical protein